MLLLTLVGSHSTSLKIPSLKNLGTSSRQSINYVSSHYMSRSYRAVKNASTRTTSNLLSTSDGSNKLSNKSPISCESQAAKNNFTDNVLSDRRYDSRSSLNINIREGTAS